MAELKVMIEKMTDIPPINRYLSAIAVCNSLALLASQGTLTVYLQRISLLKRIQKTWTKGPEVTLSLTADTDSDEELQPVGPKETWNIRNDLESVRIELDEASILPDGYLLEPVKQDVKDKILEDVKQVKEEEKQLTKQALRSSGSRPQRLKKTSKGQQRRKTKTGKSSAIAHTPHGQTDQFASETLSIGSTGEGTPDGDQAGSTEVDFICTDCGLHLKTFVQLRNHRRQEHAFNSDQQILAKSPKDVVRGAGNRLNESNKPNKRKKRHKDSELVCPVCDKKFSMKYELRLHQTIHSGERPYMCSVCGKRFRVRSSLTGHMKIHLEDKRHSCSQCGKSFVQSSSLKDHLSVHSKLRPHICNVCGKDFIRVTTLNYHMRSHTGERPYCCLVCEKRFALSRQLNIHLRIHSNEWRYSCDVCSKKFKFKGGLNRHKRLHEEMKPFSCSVCPKVFTQAGNLRVHMRTHTGEKPYVCSNCGQKFAHQPSLKKHRESCR